MTVARALYLLALELPGDREVEALLERHIAARRPGGDGAVTNGAATAARASAAKARRAVCTEDPDVCRCDGWRIGPGIAGIRADRGSP
jgi:hypothetical protein